MPKFLRAVRLDDSDDHLFKTHGAAREGEWMVSGGYAVCDFANAPKCDPRCYCESSFLALWCLGGHLLWLEIQRVRPGFFCFAKLL